VAFGQVATLS